MFDKFTYVDKSWYNNCVLPIGSFTMSNILAFGSPSELEY